VKLLGREAQFVARYETHAHGSARVGSFQQTLVLLPRLALEVLAVVVLAVLFCVVVIQGRPPDELLPILGLFGAAAFRVMPSASRMINAVQIIRNSLPVVDVIYEELAVQPEESAAVAAPPIRL